MISPESHRTVFDIKAFLNGWKPHLHSTIDQEAGATAVGEYQRMLNGETRPWAQYTLIAVTMLQTALVLLGNGPLMSAWLLAMLVAAIGLTLLFPPKVGIFGGISILLLWVLFRQTTGIWTNAVLAQNLLEIAGLAASVGLAIRYRYLWQQQRAVLRTLVRLQQVLVAGESGTGLLPPEVAELRLQEETDRAREFGRPLGLLLINYQPLSNQDIAPSTLKEIEKAISRKLAGISLVHDIPFRRGDYRIGLILPERDWERTYADATEIVQTLNDTVFMDSRGQAQSVTRYVQLGAGLGTYQGEPAPTIDLMRAAEDSLYIGQTLFALGEQVDTVYAMPAAPQLVNK